MPSLSTGPAARSKRPDRGGFAVCTVQCSGDLDRRVFSRDTTPVTGRDAEDRPSGAPSSAFPTSGAAVVASRSPGLAIRMNRPLAPAVMEERWHLQRPPARGLPQRTCVRPPPLLPPCHRAEGAVADLALWTRADSAAGCRWRPESASVVTARQNLAVRTQQPCGLPCHGAWAPIGLPSGMLHMRASERRRSAVAGRPL